MTVMVSCQGPVWMPWWRHQMEPFSALLALCAGNSPVPVNSPHKGQWRGALMFSLISAWINDWVNNREAGDLRRHRCHYDVIVMQRLSFQAFCLLKINVSSDSLIFYDRIYYTSDRALLYRGGPQELRMVVIITIHFYGFIKLLFF